jgi:5-methylthioribose kinase
MLKQAGPWPEEHPQSSAPLERANVERCFYQRIAALPEVAAAMPRLLAADQASGCLLFEDLGADEDLCSSYRRDELSSEELRALGRYLRHLHSAASTQRWAELENRRTRELHHQRVFVAPYRPVEGVDLDGFEPGLERAATSLRNDSNLRQRVVALGERYLAGGSTLVHGEFWPGAWVRTSLGIRIVDPELCGFGDPELDLGVAIAHLVLSRHALGAEQELIEAAVDPAPDLLVHEALVAQYAGTEVIRRLIGAEQLPLVPTSGFRASMLDRARVAILEDTLEAFHT